MKCTILTRCTTNNYRGVANTVTVGQMKSLTISGQMEWYKFDIKYSNIREKFRGCFDRPKKLFFLRFRSFPLPHIPKVYGKLLELIIIKHNFTFEVISHQDCQCSSSSSFHLLSIENQQLPTTGGLEDDNTPFDGNYSHSFFSQWW